MRPAHAGPGHDVGCLATMSKNVPCRCVRRDWLQEWVPRHVARREVIEQLAGWALEQHTFTQADVPNLHGPFGVKPEKWVRDALTAGSRIAGEVFMDVRRRGLHMLEELRGLDDPLPPPSESESSEDVSIPDDREVVDAPLQGVLL